MSSRQPLEPAPLHLPPNPKRSRWFVWFVGISTVAGAALAAWLIWGPVTAPPQEKKAFPVPGYSESRFLNTDGHTAFVGAQVCAECHRGKHESYLLTAHSQALADLDPNAEPPDGSFTHALSGRSYRAYRQDGQLRHEEVLRRAAGKEIGRVDLPLRYRVGSGHSARTYIVEVDGFPHESPITWYASKKHYGMSPGYDKTEPLGFERPIKAGCLVCHAGRVESSPAVYRPRLQEKVIGCESCHGPGQSHVALRKAGQPAPAGDDLTIVNPGKLARSRLEAICAACHQMGAARIYLRGRQAGDFRPGMPLEDYCIDYRLDVGAEQMTVVGHMEQLRRSVCYQKSDLSCLTCHDPHAREKPKDPTAFYRQKCLSCHTAQACKLDSAQRLKQDAADSCAACHMPRGATDIPHVAFTHHRIGIHAPKPAEAVAQVPELVPTSDVSALTPLDRRRNLGLAYLQAAQQPEHAQHAGVFTKRGLQLLGAVYEEGLHDADVAGALADLYMPVDATLSTAFAREALAAENASAEVRGNALALLSANEIKARNYSAANGLLKELVSLRRGSDDWALLGISHQLQHQPREALTAFRKRWRFVRTWRPSMRRSRKYMTRWETPSTRKSIGKKPAWTPGEKKIRSRLQ